jgi:hypothetical protein
MLICGGSSGPKVWSDSSETEVSQTCVACIVHENARLGCRSVCFGTFRDFTNPLEISMYYAARVEIAETVGNVGYLARG